MDTNILGESYTPLWGLYSSETPIAAHSSLNLADSVFINYSYISPQSTRLHCSAVLENLNKMLEYITQQPAFFLKSYSIIPVQYQYFDTVPWITIPDTVL